MPDNNIIYLDHAATTPVDPEVVKAMQPYFSHKFGNPSTIYNIGREVRAVLDQARDTVSSFLGADQSEIIFTSGGTESNNLALIGASFANEKNGNHIITTAIEHHSIIEPLRFLEKRGFEVTYLPVDKYGLVDPQDIEEAITEKTILITIMHANNEIGTIQPIADISKIAKQKGIIFHTDAVQSVASIPVNVDELGVDLLSMSAHKFYGPKGTGALYVRKGTRLIAHMLGGDQERRRRAGTENIAGIVGMAKAIDIAAKRMDTDASQISALRDRLISGMLDSIEETSLNGHPTKRLPNNANIAFRYIEGESMLLNLDAQNIYVSTGSACSSSTLEASHVLLGIGLSHEKAHGSIRFTLGRSTTAEQIDTVVEKMSEIVTRLRMMSPLYQKGN